MFKQLIWHNLKLNCFDFCNSPLSVRRWQLDSRHQNCCQRANLSCKGLLVKHDSWNRLGNCVYLLILVLAHFRVNSYGLYNKRRLGSNGYLGFIWQCCEQKPAENLYLLWVSALPGLNLIFCSTAYPWCGCPLEKLHGVQLPLLSNTSGFVGLVVLHLHGEETQVQIEEVLTKLQGDQRDGS